jgi:hypothetical protein
MSQAFLFSTEELPARVVTEMVRREQEQADWTAIRLKAMQPGLFLTICRMLGVPAFSKRSIAELCGVSEKTVRAVAIENPAPVTAFREKMTVRRRLRLERIGDEIDECLERGDKVSIEKAYRLSIMHNIFDQQERLETGAPTQRLQIEAVPSDEEYRRWMEMKRVKAAETGFAGGVAVAKGGAGDGAGAVAAHGSSVVLQGEDRSAPDCDRSGGGGGGVAGRGPIPRLVSRIWGMRQSARTYERGDTHSRGGAGGDPWAFARDSDRGPARGAFGW